MTVFRLQAAPQSATNPPHKWPAKSAGNRASDPAF